VGGKIGGIWMTEAQKTLMLTFDHPAIPVGNTTHRHPPLPASNVLPNVPQDFPLGRILHFPPQ